VRTTDHQPAEAVPRTPEEWADLPSNPEVLDDALEREVHEVVHFTTMSGAVGIMASGAIKSRHRLPADAYLEHIYQPNAQDRSRDLPWHDYVNLSVTRINDWLFNSSVRWHKSEEVEWLIFSFDPSILQDPGVVFTTTNNAYPNCHRAEGVAGFRSMFAPKVAGHGGHIYAREGLPDNCPTDRRAEVMYPGQLTLETLNVIYARNEDTLDNLSGAIGALNLSVRTEWRPAAFR
jgi:hypothetical protein